MAEKSNQDPLMATTTIDSVADRVDQPIRSDLIEKAVRFLQDPKVAQTPVPYQKSFLQKKGLNDVEINEVFRKHESAPQSTILPIGVQTYAPLTNVQQRTTWRDYANLIVLAGGATYVTVNLVKNFIMPRFFGIPTAEQRQLNSVQENLSDVQNGLKFLVDSVQQTLSIVQQQQEVSNRFLQHLTTKEDSSKSLEHSVAELKNEMAKIKDLLLTTDKFTAVPITPKVPTNQWTCDSISKRRTFENGDSHEITSNGLALVDNEGSPV